MKKLNGFSIVIATKGRVKLLGDLLESVYIARQNFDGESEVILVDDSNENDVKEIEKLCEKYDARRIYFSPSVAEKRNVGARAGKYDIILFLDSDCIATPNLLNEHYKLYTEERVGGVAGLLEFVGEDTWFWEAVNKSPFVVCFGLPRWLPEVPWTPTANCSVRKEVFEKVGGFDKRFPNKPGGEDVDLGLCITKKGYTFKCTKDGLVYHSKKTWIPVKAMFKRLWHYGAANYYLMDKHEDYVMGILPRKLTVFFIVFLFMVANAVVFKNPLILLLYPLWLIFDTAMMSLFFNHFAKYKSTSFLHQFVVQLLILTNEAGFFWKCMRKGKPSYINKDIVYFQGQMEGILHNGMITTWSNITSIFCLIAAVLLIFA
ncbi:MAG: glycosyltransferase [Schaedlerella sp.]|nr:glycosyltransferase [Schaedlerella sp.]